MKHKIEIVTKPGRTRKSGISISIAQHNRKIRNRKNVKAHILTQNYSNNQQINAYNNDERALLFLCITQNVKNKNN